MAYVPQEAIDIFTSNEHDPVAEILEKHIKTFVGHPASRRSAERWYLWWKRGIANTTSTHEPSHVSDFDDESVEEIPPKNTENADGSRRLFSKSSRITSIDELLVACNVDLSVWEYTRPKIKTYEGYRRNESKDLSLVDGRISGHISDHGELTIVTMYSIEVTLIPRRTVPFEDTISALIERMYAAPKIHTIAKIYRAADYMFMPAAFDVHFGRRDVTNTYTPTRTAAEFIKVHDALLSRAVSMDMPVERILFPIAGDVLNADTMHGTTTRGTLQEMSADIRDVALAASASHITAIEHALEMAPVDVKLVKGNHDEYGMFWLALVIKAFFSNHRYSKYITVDIERAPRKYYQYGQNLIGLEHGDKVKEDKLAGMMSIEAPPEMWSSTKHRSFFRGHFHREREVYIRVSDQLGISVTTIPTFAPPDEWEVQMGFIGNKRRAEGRFFHKENGPAGMFPVFVEDLVE